MRIIQSCNPRVDETNRSWLTRLFGVMWISGVMEVPLLGNVCGRVLERGVQGEQLLTLSMIVESAWRVPVQSTFVA